LDKLGLQPGQPPEEPDLGKLCLEDDAPLQANQSMNNIEQMSEQY
jgi:hypothetical protein